MSTSIVRGVLERTRGNPSTGSAIFQDCHKLATQLSKIHEGNGTTTSAATASVATTVTPNKSAKGNEVQAAWSVFPDFCVAEDEMKTHPGPLNGVVMGISDCLNVNRVRTTSGIQSSLLHHLPHTDDPLVALLRSKGVRFTGKVASHAPLGYLEGTMLDRNRAAEAVNHGACHAVVTSGLGGPPGIGAALHGCVSYHPTRGSLLDASSSSGSHSEGKNLNHHLSTIKYSNAFVAKSLQDITAIWSGLSETDADGGAVAAEEGSTGEGQQMEGGSTSLAAKISAKLRGEAVVVDEDDERGDTITETQVGVPDKSFLAHFDRDRHGSSFLQCLERHIEAQRTSRNHQGVKILFEEISLTVVQFESALKCSSIISQYELAEAFKTTLELSGLLSELPAVLIPAIEAGQKTSKAQYEEALGQVKELHEQLSAEFQEVDLIALPLLAKPFQHGVLSSIAFALPWHLSGYPTISLPLPVTGGPGVGPVLLVGEMGDDRGLLEQATAFVKAAC